jgi:hypothetical protein
MKSAKWSLVVVLLAAHSPAQEQPAQNARKLDLAALQGVWEKVRVPKGATSRIQIVIKGDQVDLLAFDENDRRQSVGLTLDVGEVKGIKVISLALLGKRETFAYSVEGDELVLAANSKLFGREGVLLRGEWVRVKPKQKP